MCNQRVYFLFTGPFLLTNMLVESMKPNSRKFAPAKPEPVEEENVEEEAAKEEEASPAKKEDEEVSEVKLTNGDASAEEKSGGLYYIYNIFL